MPAADPILVVENIVKRFETQDGVLTAVDDVSFNVAPGEFLVGDRAVRLRQVHAVQRDGRAARRLRRSRQRRRRDRARAACLDRHDLPGGVDLPLAHRDRQRGVSARDRRHGRRPSGSSEARHFIDLVGLERLRAALSGGTVRRHAPARVDGAHARLRAENPADGRAVRGARRADAAPARRQGAADPAGPEADHAAHHPQPDRGGAALRPHPGDDLPAGPDSSASSRSSCRARAPPRSSAATTSAATSRKSGAICARRRAKGLKDDEARVARAGGKRP